MMKSNLIILLIMIFATLLKLSSCCSETEIIHYEIQSITNSNYNSQDLSATAEQVEINYGQYAILFGSLSTGLENISHGNYRPPKGYCGATPIIIGDSPIDEITVWASKDFQSGYPAGTPLNPIFRPIKIDNRLRTVQWFEETDPKLLDHYLDQYHEITDFYNSEYKFSLAFALVSPPDTSIEDIRFYLSLKFKGGKVLKDSTDLIRISI